MRCEDFSKSEQIVAALVEAQRGTEEQVRQLAEAQRRTEDAVRELAAVQRETSQSIRELTEGLEHLRKQVGGRNENLGGDIEDIASIVLHDVLKRGFGWRVGRLECSWEKWGDEAEEVNFFGLPTDPTRLGKRFGL